MTTTPFEPPPTSPAGNLYPRPPRHTPRGAHCRLSPPAPRRRRPHNDGDASWRSQRRTSAPRASVTCGPRRCGARPAAPASRKLLFDRVDTPSSTSQLGGEEPLGIGDRVRRVPGLIARPPARSRTGDRTARGGLPIRRRGLTPAPPLGSSYRRT